MKCGWCDQEAMCCALPGGEGLCRRCYKLRCSETRGYPDCGNCGHPYFLMLFACGAGFRCLGCGGKFSGTVRDEEHEEWRPNWWHDHDQSGLR